MILPLPSSKSFFLFTSLLLFSIVICWKYDVPMIQSWSPGAGFAGTTVLVHGENFEASPKLQCKFGELVVLAKYLSSKTIKCVAPNIEDGTVELQVSNDGIKWAQKKATFTFLVSPESVPITSEGNVSLIPQISHYSPAKGPARTVIEAHGDDFLNVSSLRCKFGNLSVEATFISPRSIKCRAPWNEAGGTVSFRVSNDGFKFSTGQETFTYEILKEDLPPKLREVTPVKGPPGTMVSFFGRDFVRNVTLSCRFDKVMVKATFVTSEMVICRAPPTLIGTQKVSISNNGLAWSTEYLTFTIDDKKEGEAPVVTSINPSEGPVGSQINVFGDGFKNTEKLTCRFGVVETKATYLTSTQISCVAPPRFPGPVYLEVANDGSKFSETETVFVYQAGNKVPALMVVDPNSGAEGIQINLHGKDFEASSELQCRFNETVTVLAKYINAKHIVCIAPSGLLGKVVLEVSNDGKKFASGQKFFTFVQGKPVILKINPSSGPGGVTVTVTGRDFKEKKSFCNFEETSVPAVVVSANTLTCKAPYLKGSVHLYVSDENSVHSNEVQFIFKGTPIPRVKAVDPPAASVGSLINIVGSDFENSTKLTCRFGDVFVFATFISPTLIVCIAPENTEKKVFLEVANDGISFSAGRKRFVYLYSGVSFLTICLVVSVVVLVLAVGLVFNKRRRFVVSKRL